MIDLTPDRGRLQPSDTAAATRRRRAPAVARRRCRGRGGDVRRRERRPLDAAHAAPVHARRRRGVGGEARAQVARGALGQLRRRGSGDRQSRRLLRRCASTRRRRAARSATSCTATWRPRRRRRLRRPAHRLGLRRPRRGAACEIRADVRNVGLAAHDRRASGYRFEAVLRDAETVRGERVTTCSTRCCRVTHGRGGTRTRSRPAFGWPRLTDGRWSSGPSSRTTPRPSGPPVAIRRWPLDLRAAESPYSLADADEFIADSRHRLLLGERARLAVTDSGRAASSSAASASTSSPTGRRRRSATGSRRRRAAGRRPGERRASSWTGPSASSASSASSC